jgi:dipeptidase D
MMMSVIEYFELLTHIPHCSHEAHPLRDFLVAYGRERGYRVEVDGADNILIFRGEPKLCLQAHYDMVCMGRAPEVETYVEEGWLKARESSLGADNGIAIAMMMALMDAGEDLEFLLTADEEVGLIGASALDFPLYSQSMLNLDFEDEAEVCIGCAGGADVLATKTEHLVEGSGQCYEVAVKGLAGGHSGVDIDKGIPSAIKELGGYLHQQGITQLAALYGGERRNSIPANAVAIVRSENTLASKSHVTIRALREQPKVFVGSERIIALIEGFGHGVRSQNSNYAIPDTSINLAIVSCNDTGVIEIETSARAMDKKALETLILDTHSYFEQYGLQVTVDDEYPAWKPELNAFTALVGEQMHAVFGSSHTMAIHAGLECGILKERYPHISFASIGPTIQYPHSTRERVDIASVERTFEVVQKIIEATR